MTELSECMTYTQTRNRQGSLRLGMKQTVSIIGSDIPNWYDSISLMELR